VTPLVPAATVRVAGTVTPGLLLAGSRPHQQGRSAHCYLFAVVDPPPMMDVGDELSKHCQGFTINSRIPTLRQHRLPKSSHLSQPKPHWY